MACFINYLKKVPVKVDKSDSHPYNLNFCKDIIESAKIQRQERLKETNKVV